MKGVLLFLLSLNCWGAVILLDPGHGGKDQGTSYLSLLEKNLSLKLTLAVKKILKSTHQVYLTRSSDRTLSLEERSRMAQLIQPDLFLSLHFNSNPKENVRGIETYYLGNNSQEAVQRVHELKNHPLISEKELFQRNVKINELSEKSKRLALFIDQSFDQVFVKASVQNRGVMPALFYVLALSHSPALLIEAGYFTNEKDRLLVQQNEFHQNFAQALKQGIDLYFQ